MGVDFTQLEERARSMSVDDLHGAVADLRASLDSADEMDRANRTDRGGDYRDTISVFVRELATRVEPSAPVRQRNHRLTLWWIKTFIRDAVSDEIAEEKAEQLLLAAKDGFHRGGLFVRLGGRCGGRFRNGPEKRWARCDTCGVVDHEANEGDACRVGSEQ